MDSQINLPLSLEASRITALPPAAYYIPDFISEEEEQAILHKVARHASSMGPLASNLTECCKGRDGTQGEMEATHAPPTPDMAIRPRQEHTPRCSSAA